MPKPLTAWSYSRYATYAQCPFKFKEEVINGNKQPQSAPMARGHEIHGQAAKYVDRKTDTPPDVKHHVPLMDEIRSFGNMVIEQQWGFNRSWQATGWFGKDTWLRSILDVGIMYEDMTVEIVDWKTGKRYGENQEQMELFAVSVFCRMQPVTHVTTRLAYLDVGGFEFGEFGRSELGSLISKWEDKVAPMFSDTEFLPRPNDKCVFCHLRRSNGGVCKYG